MISADVVEIKRFHLTAVIFKFGQHVKLNKLKSPLNVQSHAGVSSLQVGILSPPLGQGAFNSKGNC